MVRALSSYKTETLDNNPDEETSEYGQDDDEDMMDEDGGGADDWDILDDAIQGENDKISPNNSDISASVANSVKSNSEKGSPKRRNKKLGEDDSNLDSDDFDDDDSDEEDDEEEEEEEDEELANLKTQEAALADDVAELNARIEEKTGQARAHVNPIMKV
jgi:ribonuclease E